VGQFAGPFKISSGPLGQQAITVQESQLGGRRFAGTFMAGMCFEYLIFVLFLIMASPFLLIGAAENHVYECRLPKITLMNIRLAHLKCLSATALD
jgi:hypothetical protein